MMIAKELNMKIDNDNIYGVFYDKNTNEFADKDNLLVLESLDDRINAGSVLSYIFNFSSNESLIYKILLKSNGIALHNLIAAFNKISPCSERTIVRYINTLLDKKVIINSNNKLYLRENYNIKNKKVKYIIVKL